MNILKVTVPSLIQYYQLYFCGHPILFYFLPCGIFSLVLVVIDRVFVGKIKKIHITVLSDRTYGSSIWFDIRPEIPVSFFTLFTL